MTKSECPHAENLAAYALGALDEPVAVELAGHLEGCESCSSELRWLNPALEVIPESVEQLQPPPDLRRRLMETVRADAAAQAPARSRARRSRLRFGGFRLGPAIALATVLIVAAGVVGYGLRDGGGDQTRTISVAAVPQGSTARIEIHGGEATLQAQHVPPLPSGSVYQVWVARGGTVVPSSVFKPSADGSAAAAVPEALHGADRVMVTREPGTGSTVPSSAPIYTATL
jgi:anti-sigma-K factor RskA/putative zinc finger protein